MASRGFLVSVFSIQHSHENNIQASRQTRQKQTDDLDVVGNNGHILEVECCVNLIHDIQRRRFVVMQCKDECQRAQCLLTS